MRKPLPFMGICTVGFILYRTEVGPLSFLGAIILGLAMGNILHHIDEVEAKEWEAKNKKPNP